MFSWVHIYLLRAHPCPQHLDFQPGSGACYGSYPVCNRSVGSHYIKSQLTTTSHQKPFPLSPPPPADALAPLQGAKLAENSPCAVWGLGQGHGWAWARARRGSWGQGGPPSSLAVAAGISSAVMLTKAWTSECPEGLEREGRPSGMKRMVPLAHMWRFTSRFAALR